MKIALLPGGYKPVHAGHYNTAKWLAQNTDADKVIVRIGSKERDGITKEMSLKLWELYQLSDPDPTAQKIEISLFKSPSPVRDVYDFVETEAPEGSTVYLGMGEKDAEDKRYANIAKFAEPRGISFKTALIPPQSGGISGTQMRQFILDNDKESFQKYLPDHLTPELKDEAWGVVAGVVTEVTMLSEVFYNELNEAVGDKILYAFDLDDTLITSKSNIIVTNPEKGTFKLTPAEYAIYTPGPNDELDFSEFASLNEPKVIPKMFNLFSQILTKTSKLPNTKTIILTARQPDVISDIKEFLSSKGLADLKIHAVASSDPMEKVKVILDYIEDGYKNIRFYDDSPKNVRAVQTLDNSTDANVDAKLISFGKMVQEMTGGATMNRDEMKKHKNKLKKLQKVLDNQGNRMIPYPEDLPNTVFGVDMNEQKLFSKDWWVKTFQKVLQEGGAAGHMAHPFDLPQTKSGKDLVKVFVDTAKSLDKKSGSVKIDGVNASVRFNGNEFVMDRGSKKELDIKGITKDDLVDRFGEGHGMVDAGGKTLDILNKSIPSIKPELKKLGMLDDPSIMFNMEYVGGKTNVQDYDKNFLAIHTVMKMETKEVEGKRGKLTKRIATEIPYDENVLKSLIDKVNKVAEKEGFEVYGDVPTTLKKKPNFNTALSKQYTIVDGDEKITKSLKAWIEEIKQTPKDKFVTLNGKKMGAVSKAVYMYVLDQDDVSMFDDKKAAIDGAITYLATEKLGDEILKVLDSPMGSVEEHEGVVIRDPDIYDGPYKITGKFILGGMATSFRN